MIPAFAFSGCKKLNEIDIPKSVDFICEGAFSKCSSLTHIFIPSSCVKISFNSCECCESLVFIGLTKSIPANEIFTQAKILISKDESDSLFEYD
ncbi:hypothetical protein M9Y10_027792 [Tritrichomonas musculus]|uniref:Uncharacterized protein n=1 Tax=Tritrichomonas musculus TaxID=1915356 RepID=A0ABR2H403_9EUKA